jgi:hypothetical protein
VIAVGGELTAIMLNFNTSSRKKPNETVNAPWGKPP